MEGTPAKEKASSPRIDLKSEIAHSEWKDDPKIGFEQRASLAIARWILIFFAGVYCLGFIATFILIGWKDATFDKGSEHIKFLVQLPLPLVTLAVGYYLGDRNKPTATRSRK
jgi:hypothetical protein